LKKSASEIAEPIRTKERTDTEEPMVCCSMMDRFPPTLALPTVEQLDPMRTNRRIENEEPHPANDKIDMLEPSLQNERTERLDPIWAKPIIETFITEPTAVTPITDNELPTRA
jgi:hypothetical protein